MNIQILVGSTSGNTEFLASELAAFIQANSDYQTALHDQPELAEVPIHHTTWLICAATHGAGEHAESLIDFIAQLTAQQPQLTTVNYALIQVGDSSYDTFCSSGQAIHELLQSLGAQPVVEPLTIDMLHADDPEQMGIDWLKNWLK